MFVQSTIVNDVGQKTEAASNQQQRFEFSGHLARAQARIIDVDK